MRRYLALAIPLYASWWTGGSNGTQWTPVAGVDYATPGDVTAAVDAHAALSDPHTGYQKESEKGSANGYASLGSDGLVPSSQLPAASGPAFPVGSVFISVVSTNPNTLLGYGTWSAFGAGRVLVGLDAAQTEFDVVEETGGEKTHTLTSAEMPSHTHVQDAHNHTQNSFAPRIINSGTAGAVGVQGASGASNANASNSATTATNQAATATNQSTGGGGAHNNLQPYIVCYFWKRTS